MKKIEKIFTFIFGINQKKRWRKILTLIIILGTLAIFLFVCNVHYDKKTGFSFGITPMDVKIKK